MGYYSTATFNVTSKEQIEAAKKYEFHSSLIPELKLEEIMKINGFSIGFEGLTSDDFDKLIPGFSRYLAEMVPNKDFSCDKAYCEYSVSFSVISYKVEYHNKHLKVISLHEGDGWDEYDYDAIEDMEGIALIPPFKFIGDVDQFISDITEEYDCNISDNISDETDFIVTNLKPDDFTDEINEAIENGAETAKEYDFLCGCDLWRFTQYNRPWDVVIDEDIAGSN